MRDFENQYLADMIPYPVYLKKITGEIIYCNRRFREYFEIGSGNDIIGKKISDLYDGADFSIHEEKDREFIESEANEKEYSVVYEVPGKGLRDLRIRNAKLLGENGLIALMGVVTDITEIKALEKRLSGSLDEMSKLSEKRKNFASFW